MSYGKGVPPWFTSLRLGGYQSSSRHLRKKLQYVVILCSVRLGSGRWPGRLRMVFFPAAGPLPAPMVGTSGGVGSSKARARVALSVE